jgi:hypothetical protein
MEPIDHAPPPEPPRPRPVEVPFFRAPRTHRDALRRIRALIGLPIRYGYGAGQVLHPWQVPRDGSRMDCSETACYAVGVSKLTNEPLYKRVNGGWRNCAAIIVDAKSTEGVFTRVTEPKPGYLYVWAVPGTTDAHVGIIETVENGKVTGVIDCSSYHQKTKGYAVARRSPSLWIAKRAIIVRCDWLDD